MPFPASERVVFGNNPLESVVTQVQFAPVLSIAAEEPAAFQNLIRADYPLYAREDTVELPPELAQVFASVGRPLVSVRHVFRSLDGQRSIFLTRDFLAYEDKSYRRWEEFRGQAERAFRALHEVYHPTFISRVGLRYINVIRQSALGLAPPVPWAELIGPGLIGLLGQADLRDRVTEVLGIVSVKINDVPGGTVRIQYGLREQKPDVEAAYFIDSDFFTLERSDVANALGVLGHFSIKAGNLFRWAVTPRLLAALRPAAYPTT